MSNIQMFQTWIFTKYSYNMAHNLRYGLEKIFKLLQNKRKWQSKFIQNVPMNSSKYRKDFCESKFIVFFFCNAHKLLVSKCIQFAYHLPNLSYLNFDVLLISIAGFSMILDILEERGLGDADIKWGDPNECRFPLFSFLQPLPLQWMCIIYLIMWIGNLSYLIALCL